MLHIANYCLSVTSIDLVEEPVIYKGFIDCDQQEEMTDVRLFVNVDDLSPLKYMDGRIDITIENLIDNKNERIEKIYFRSNKKEFKVVGLQINNDDIGIFTDRPVFSKDKLELQIDWNTINMLKPLNAICKQFNKVNKDYRKRCFGCVQIQEGYGIATDGNRLSKVKLTDSYTLFSALIPQEMIEFIIKNKYSGILSKRTITKDIRLFKAKENVLTFITDDFIIMKKEYNDTFPNFSRVFPPIHNMKIVEFDAEKMKEMIKFETADYKKTAIRFSGSKHTIINLDSKKVMEPKTFDTPEKFQSISGFSVNLQFLMDALEINCNKIAFSDSDSPIFVGNINSDEYGNGTIIMPMNV
jgi:hypothetical protein